MSDLLVKHLVREEGLRLEPYQDHLGFWTLGIGHLIDSRKGGTIPVGVRSFPITEEQAYQILNDDLHRLETLLWRALPWVKDISEVRRVALTSMAFQLGVSGLLGFENMIEDMKHGNWKSAANEMLDSRWASQTPRRALRLADAVRRNDASYLVRGT